MEKLSQQEVIEEAKKFWFWMADTNKNFQRQMKKFTSTGETEIIIKEQ